MMDRSLYPMSAEMNEQRYPFAVMALAPLVAIFIQAYVPLRFPKFEILDLPLIVTLYFALARRSQVYGALLGTGTGILQDALTHLPLGINGICKAIVGYLAASVSNRLDVENTGARLVLVLVLTMLHSVLHLVIVRLMLDLHPGWHWGYEFLRAALNTFVSLIFFKLLDLFRRQN
jgi:rod shape-determining protein MreD